jgi:hypothetical protein
VCDPKPHYGIKDLDVQRGGVLLVKLTEAETSKTTFTLIEKPGTSDERVLATDERKVELLPRINGAAFPIRPTSSRRSFNRTNWPSTAC